MGGNLWAEEGRALQMKGWFFRMKGKLTAFHRHVDLVSIAFLALVVWGFFCCSHLRKN